MKNLLQKAVLKISKAEVAGETIYIREPNFAQMRDYYQLNEKGEGRDALISLFESSLVNEDGSPAVTREEAVQLVDGNRNIFLAVLNAITAPMAAGESKKD